uniref:Uncharacterized protein n=1 Tax=Anguilla anguilla TaxID=7936 RepID=A0A0E9WMP0_ANGAN
MDSYRYNICWTSYSCNIYSENIIVCFNIFLCHSPFLPYITYSIPRFD